MQQKIRSISDEQKNINDLQKHIATYGKTRAVHKEYKSISDPKRQNEFYEVNRADISRHQSAKKYFDEHGHKGKLPSIDQLRGEWAKLEKQCRSLRAEYKTANQKFKELCTAKSNAHRMLGLDKNPKTSHGYATEI